MPIQKNLANINVGITPNDNTGDLLRDAFIKVNANFNSLYTNGQYLGGEDNRFLPSYSWVDEKNTGIYRVGPGSIAVSLKGRDSLVLDEVGTISWFGAALATQAFVNSKFDQVTGGGTGGGGGEVGGIPVVESLPTAGNYIGRLAFYLGDVWVYSNYPIGNGAGLAPNPDIAREAGSDNRWVRFRGDIALPTGATRPSSSPEGTLFYQTTDNTIYLYIQGAWKTLSSVITSNSPAGLEVLPSLPLASNPSNYSGRTVVVGNKIYVFVNSVWNDLNTYVSGGGGGGTGIIEGEAIPASGTIGDLFKKLGTDAGLYIYSGEQWQRIETFVGNRITTGIRTFSALPTNLQTFNPGDIVQVSNVFYILNLEKNNWDLFTPGNILGGGTVTVSLGPESVDTVNIRNGAVTGDKLLTNTIPGVRLQLASITSRELQTNSVIGSKIFPGSVTTAKIATAAVDTLRLSDNSVTSAKIVPGSITNEKLAANAISGDKIRVTNLSDLTTRLGTVRTGKMVSTDNRMIIDLDQKIIRIEI